MESLPCPTKSVNVCDKVIKCTTVVNFNVMTYTCVYVYYTYVHIIRIGLQLHN